MNTAWWNTAQGVFLTAADVPKIDRVEIDVMADSVPFTVSNLCLSGIVFGKTAGTTGTGGQGGAVGTCGNGFLDSGEGCDDGNLNPGDGCSSLCKKEPYWSCPEPGYPCVYLGQ